MSKREFKNNISLSGEIADILRERILRGEYKIGEKIKENQIALELEVSRSPIRDAFKQLETEGLLDYVPNRGCFAKGFTKQDVSDIYSVRTALEKIAIGWAIERITPDEIDKLEEQCQLMDFYTQRGDEKKVLELNTSFHDIIYNSSGSRFLAQVLRSYKEYLDKTRKAMFYDKSFLESIQSEHLEIFNAIKEKDKKRGTAAITKHLDESRKRTEKVWNLK